MEAVPIEGAAHEPAPSALGLGVTGEPPGTSSISSADRSAPEQASGDEGRGPVDDCGAGVGVPAGMMHTILKGAAAGAAGTTAINATTYLDMALRGRGASSTPQQTVEALADKTPADVPGTGEERQNRVSGLGPLMGMATGVGVGVAYAALTSVLLRPPLLVGAVLTAAAATAGSLAPMTALGVSKPASWGFDDWASDVVPHAVYGLVTAATYDALTS